ncbi:prolyl aminopeptidase [Aureimonas fodinaquatilis]|uniref:Proline iminopeptidase n=1 Tax=Aureimonas fodinaquatilis TaxID=2565783 RepID=A0A5B0E0M7_9HYPH|nr:prolyl aminopeptidase [Aureimonas fodinaquatilis]KAA0971019.1 prolyl aminopeptidase [Aureimonas fodinaquatilis]
MKDRAAVLYPAIEPYNAGLLDVGGGHSLYWELCGNPNGIPVVFLHGGPGSGSGPVHRRLFDPELYRILLFDQRGCGRSLPLGQLEGNTTQDLVADIERLRQFTQTERWLVFGGSWGATLALAYAQAHPAHVSGLILRGVFTGRQQELDWFYKEGASRIFPHEWEHFLAPLTPLEQLDPVTSYRTLLTHPDRSIRAAAARAWTDWEARTVSMRHSPPVVHQGVARDATIAFARIENHFFFHKLWLREAQLLEDAGKLAGIPGIIVQGRYDVVTPPVTAWELHKAWPGSRLKIVEDAGHAFSEPGTLESLVEATNEFSADLRQSGALSHDA